MHEPSGNRRVHGAAILCILGFSGRTGIQAAAGHPAGFVVASSAEGASWEYAGKHRGRQQQVPAAPARGRLQWAHRHGGRGKPGTPRALWPPVRRRVPHGNTQASAMGANNNAAPAGGRPRQPKPRERPSRPRPIFPGSTWMAMRRGCRCMRSCARKLLRGRFGGRPLRPATGPADAERDGGRRKRRRIHG